MTMDRPQDIDEALRDWPFSPGVVSARLLEADDGRHVVQMRVELGLLQMETDHRPDGHKPHGYDTYLDYLMHEAARSSGSLLLSVDDCAEVDREFLQYYHRRLCWLALRQFRRAVADADHALAMMDFVADHSPDPEWTASHERYRSFVLFHRAQAAALAALEDAGPEGAVEEIDRGLGRLRAAVEALEEGAEPGHRAMLEQLAELREWLKKNYQIDHTLQERLAAAIAAEQYELAARLRDEIDQRAKGKGA